MDGQDVRRIGGRGIGRGPTVAMAATGLVILAAAWGGATPAGDGLPPLGAGGVSGSPEGSDVQMPPAPPTTSDDLEAFLEESFRDLALVPGMAVAVVRGDSTLLLRGFGVADVASGTPMTEDTPLYIASSTKSFMGTAAAILEENEVWGLDDPVARWIPDLRLPAPLSPAAITLADLLTHTSRIESGEVVFRTAYTGEHDRATLLRLLADSEVLEPGFDYGNIGYVVASLAMDRAVDGTWKDVLAEEIFRPLGMDRTSAYRSDFDGRMLALPHGTGLGPRAFDVWPFIKTDRNMHAAGGIITTAADLSRWLRVNLADGRLDGRQALPAGAVRAALAKRVDVEAEFHEFRRTGYGLGWYHSEYDGELVIHHFGNYPGFRAHVSMMPEHGIGVAVLTNNSSLGYYVPEFVATSVYDRLLDKPDLAARYDSAAAFLRADADRVLDAVRADVRRRATRPDSMIHPLATYAGTYSNPGGGTMIVGDAGLDRLAVRIGDLASLAEPIDGETTVRVELTPGSGEVVEFLLAGGRADSLEYSGAVWRRR